MTDRALRLAVAVLTAVPVLSGCSSSPGDAPIFSFEATPPTRALAVAGKACGSNFPQPGAGRRVTTDAGGIVYVATVCDGEAHVAASRDGAKTFGPAVPTGITGLSQLTIQGGPLGVAYLVGLTSDSVGGTAAHFTRTTNQGAAWEAPRVIATGMFVFQGVSIAARGDEVLVQVTSGPSTVYRNASRGAGEFTPTTLPAGSNAAFFGILVDSAGRIWSGFDTPQLYLSSSTDGGATFTPWVTVTGASVFYSTWAIGADVIWVAGSDSSPAYRIPVATPTVATPVFGTAQPVDLMETALAADDAGTAYFAAATSGGVQLQRALRSDTTFGAASPLDPLGRRPSLATPGEPGVVVVAYERPGDVFGEIWTAVQVY